MAFQTCEDIGHGITRIETGMIRDELAACYLVQSNDEYVLVETGTHNTIPAIMDLLADRGIEPGQVKYVIPTHVHLDHAGGVGGLMQALSNATLVIHPKGARHMVDPSKLKAGAMAVYGEAEFERIYGDIIPVDQQRVQEAEDGTEIVFGERKFIIYDTPGHARHHFCVYDPQSSGIFSGDTFGLAYPVLATNKGAFILPTTTPVQFEPEALKVSVEKLLALQPERIYLTHYGPVETPEDLGPQLLQQIDDYVELAVAAEKESSEEDLEQCLIQKITSYTLGRAKAHGCKLDDEELNNLLAMDMKLNSQGLIVWLGKR